MIGPNGEKIPVGTLVVTDRTTVCAAVSPLPEGIITITAGDGDAQTNAFQFEATDGIKPAGTPATCADLSLPAPGTGGSDTVLGLGRTTAVAGGGFLATRTVRRRRTQEGIGAG
ncbi:hypothetical protein [Streptomyces sp. 4F14]|uniref:hypothetical protein n=1 Tax=Streptomyces sp. 4F14 TaxID=3394380 RepID=UPI003A865C41